HQERPQGDPDRGTRLFRYAVGLTGVLPADAVAEDPDVDDADDAAHEVNPDDPDTVTQAGAPGHGDHRCADRPSENAERERPRRGQDVAGRRDGDDTSHDAGGHAPHA